MYQGYQAIECLANEERTPTVVEFDAIVLRDTVRDARVKMSFADFLPLKPRLEKLANDYMALMGQATPAYKARERRLARKIAEKAFDVSIYSY